jgi:hypothetical protein
VNYKSAKALLDGEGKRRGPRDSLKIARNTYLERGSALSVRHESSLDRMRGIVNAPGYYNAASNSYPDNAIGMRLHNTYVVIFTPHWTELNTGGWPTVTTYDRMRYVDGISVSCTKSGLQVVLTNDVMPCWNCDATGIYKYARRVGDEYVADVCARCGGSCFAPYLDWSNGHPFFDGIRIAPDGRRLLKTQPHKPERHDPIYTRSGFTGDSIHRGTYFGHRY